MLYHTYTESGAIDPANDPDNCGINAAGTESPESFTLTAGKTADVHYYDEIGYYDKFTQEDTEVNAFHRFSETDGDQQTTVNTALKGLRIADCHQIGPDGADADTEGDTLTVSVKSFAVYKIYVDGTEELMTDDEKEAFTADGFTVTYTAGADDDPLFESDCFVYDTTDSSDPKIVVSEASNFENGVYTLNAEYNGFTAAFDIVFLRSAP